MKQKTLLIDLDGTLLGSHPKILKIAFISRFCYEMMAYFIYPWKSLKILSEFNRIFHLTPDLNDPRTNLEKATAHLASMTGWQTEKTVKVLTEVVYECFAKNKSFFYQIEGATEFVQWASRRYRLVLATNPLWDRRTLDLRISWTDLKLNHFALATHAENMHSCKPHLQYYQELLKMLKLHPSDAIMIGNDEVKDGPAELIGIPVFILGRDGGFDELKNYIQRFDRVAENHP